jgi:hypothetical protein
VVLQLVVLLKEAVLPKEVEMKAVNQTLFSSGNLGFRTEEHTIRSFFGSCGGI